MEVSMCLTVGRPRTTTLFPYTTLFRSNDARGVLRAHRERAALAVGERVHLLVDDVRRLADRTDRKSTRLNSSHGYTSYTVFCLKKRTARAHPLSCHAPDPFASASITST